MKTISRILSLRPGLRLAALTAGITLLNAGRLDGAIRFWGGGGVGGNWSTAANWTGGVPPVNGDDVVFQSGAAHLTNTNNLANLRLNSITFTGSGYDVWGNPVTVTNGLSGQQAAGANTIEFAVTLGAAQTFDCLTAGASQTLFGNITNAGFTLSVAGSGNFTASGVIGGAGGLTKNGTGTLTLAGAFSNTYGGPTIVNAGLVELMKNGSPAATAIPGDLVIGDGASSATVRNIYGLEIADSANLTVNGNGLWDLNNNSETVGANLTLANGAIQSGTGTATLSANAAITVSGSPWVKGKLNIGTGTCVIQGSGALDLLASVSGSANIVKNGSVSIFLEGPNTFTGTFTANNSGFLFLDNNLSLGGTNGGTILNDATYLYVNGGLKITNEALTLNTTTIPAVYAYPGQTNSWSSTNFTLLDDATISVQTNGVLDLIGPIGGAGGLTKVGPGTLIFSGSSGNTYTGLTTVNEGELDLNKSFGLALAGYGPGLVVGDGTGVDTVRWLHGYELNSIVTPVTVNSSGLLDLNGFTDAIAPLTLNGGAVTTGAGKLILAGDLTVGISSSQATISGNLDLNGATRTFDVASGPPNPEILIPAVISNGGIIKNGDGNLGLSGANSYAGSTTVNRGFIMLYNASGLGSPAAGTTLNGGQLYVGGVVVAGEGLTNNAGGDLLQSGGAAGWSGNIVLNADLNAVVLSGTLDLSGVISGVGGLNKSSSGTLTLSGASGNTYTGPTVHKEGLLLLAKTAGHAIHAGSLFIGDGVGGVHADVVRYTAGVNQINNTVPITITNSGWLDLNGLWDDLGPITLSGGDIDTGAAGELRAQGDIRVQASSQTAHLNGHVSLEGGLRTITVDHGSAVYNLEIPATIRDGGAGFIVVNGAGTGAFVRLMGSNSFTGPLTVLGLTVDAETPWSLGSTNGPTIVRNSGRLFMFMTSITNEPLTLDTGTYLSAQSDCTWAGPITLTGDATIQGVLSTGLFDVRGPISGTGNLLSLTSGGTNRFSGAEANTFVGTTTAGFGTLELNKSIYNAAIPQNLSISGTARLLRADQIADFADVLVQGGGLLDLASFSEAIDTLHGPGTVNFGTLGFIAVGGFNGTSTFDGLMSGVGYPNGYTLVKVGSGTFTLNGNNTYSNRTEVWSGKLVVNGFQPQSPLRVLTGATLGGSGTVGDIVAAGTVSPGTSPGMLTCSNLALTYSGASGSYFVELTGPTPGADYDQLNIRGTNNLANAMLNVSLAFTKPVGPGQQFIILNNDGTDPLTGIFAGFPEGATLSQNGFTVAISYVGGTGNDVVLRLVQVPGAQAGYAISSGNGNGILVPNDCASLNISLTNQTGTVMTGITATLSSADPNVVVTQPRATYSAIPANGKGANVTPYQVSVLPSFICGNPINLQLAVSSASHGSFMVPLVLPSGVPNPAPARYDNNVVTNVPDIGAIESTNTVFSWFGGPITKVAVSLWLVAPLDSDLNLTLVAPDGTSVDLSSGNGAGANFGTGTADAARTTFDDAATTSITGSTPPFVGSFRPESALGSLTGTAPTGNWRLRIQDNFGIGSPDTLRAWSLFLYGTTCPAGGGACALCAGGTLLTNNLDTTSATLSPRLTRDSIISTCAAPKSCPGIVGGTFYYHAYPFYNASSNTCVTVTLTSLGSGDLMSVAYLGEFTPGNPCLNYLADCGSSTAGAGTKTYSFYVPSNSLFTVVVNHVGALGAYSLAVSGGDCPPLLNIQPASSPNVNLNWPTVAGGYQLESSLSLQPTVWQAVTNEPVAADDRFNVTNSAASSSNRFYRLHRP